MRKIVLGRSGFLRWSWTRIDSLTRAAACLLDELASRSFSNWVNLVTNSVRWRRRRRLRRECHLLTHYVCATKANKGSLIYMKLPLRRPLDSIESNWVLCVESFGRSSHVTHKKTKWWWWKNSHDDSNPLFNYFFMRKATPNKGRDRKRTTKHMWEAGHEPT